MSEIIYRAEVDALSVFSLDNNTATKIGWPLDAGVNMRRLPWAFHESLSSALDCWQSAEAAAEVLGGGKVGLAARIGGVWFYIDSSHLSRWVA
jgi:hypothetical protein